MLGGLLHRLPASFLRNIRWQYAANLATGLLGGAYVLLLGNELGLAGFGAYSLFTAIATLVFNAFDLRVQEAVVRFVASGRSSGTERDGSTAAVLFVLDAVARLAAFTLVALLAQPVSNLFFDGAAVGPEVTAVAALLLLSKTANAPALGLLRICDRFDLNARLQVADWSGRLGFTAVAAWQGSLEILEVVAIAAAIGGVVNVVTIAVAIRTWQRASGERIALHRDSLGRLPEMGRFVLASQGISICDSVVRELDTTLVAWYLGIESTAIYRMSKNFVQILWRAADPVFLVVMPEIRRFLVDGRRAELMEFLRAVSVVLLIGAASVVLVSALIMPWVVDAFLEPRFAPAASLFPWMAWWIVICLPLIWTHALAAASGVPQLQLLANLIGNAIAALLLVILTPLWGVWGAALGWSAGLTATFVVSFALLRRRRLISAAA